MEILSLSTGFLLRRKIRFGAEIIFIGQYKIRESRKTFRCKAAGLRFKSSN
jgi:hypothetical protein